MSKADEPEIDRIDPVLGYKSDITMIYDTFSRIGGVESTGAPKIMHLRNPGLFVMWDRPIRTRYGVGDKAGDYVAFHKLMQSEFGHLKWSRDDMTFAKAIDQYN